MRDCSICGCRIYPEGKERKVLIGAPEDVIVPCSLDCVLESLRDSGPVVIPEGVQILLGDARHITPDYRVARNGRGYRSKFEADFHDWLRRNGYHAEYEPFTVRFSVNGDAIERHYTPDFWVPQSGVLIETKGVWAAGGKKKMRRLLDAWPEVSLVLVPYALNPCLRECDV